jgi:cystathionine beta-synthase
VQEIWAQTEGRITHFVAGVGTGGTISGAGRYLKQVSGGRVQIIGADPEGSVYSGGTGRPYLVEGVGEDVWPTAFDRRWRGHGTARVRVRVWTRRARHRAAATHAR